MANITTNGKIPVVFKYALAMYDEMDRASEMMKPADLSRYGYPDDESTELVKVFIGFAKDAAAKARITVGSTTSASQLLNSLRATSLLRPGGSRMKSVYILHYRPTLEQYDAWRDEQGLSSRLIMPSKYELVLKDLERANERLANLESRFDLLEAQLAARQVVDGEQNDGGYDIRRSTPLS